MGDCTSYASIRGPHHRDYEKFPYGSLENASGSPVKSAYCIAQGKFIVTHTNINLNIIFHCNRVRHNTVNERKKHDRQFIYVYF